MPAEEKPPLGLTPRNTHDQIRGIEILRAMERYIRAGKPIPREWFTELTYLHEAV